jgi:hypothetical protein
MITLKKLKLKQKHLIHYRIKVLLQFIIIPGYL